MRAILLLILLSLFSSQALATDIDIGSSQIIGFNRNDIGNDTSMSGISVTNSSTAVTCSSCVPQNAVGLGGFKVLLNGVTYDVASVATRSAFTLTTAYAGITGTVTGTWYKWIVFRIYVTAAFVPSGSTTTIPKGDVGSQNWFRRYAVSVINDGLQNVAYLPPINDLPATTNGSNSSARYAGHFYTFGGTSISDYPGCVTQWQLNHAVNPTSWSQICAYNIPNPPPFDTTQNYYTQAQINSIHPSCASGRGVYYPATGNVQDCLIFGSGLSLVGGTLSATGLAAAYTTIQEEGTGLTQRSVLNFVGSSATAADDTTRTTVTFASPLNSLASNSTAGFWAPTGGVTGNARTITGTTNEIAVANGNGSSDPVISLPASLGFAGKTITGGTFVGPTITGVNLRYAINVMNYGCVGNGVANDTTCIANAYTAAVAAAGYYLYFPSGTYLFDGLSITASNLIIVGDGPGHSILQSRINTTAVITIDNTAAARNGIKIRDIQLTGFGSGANNHGIAITGTAARNSLTVENVKISAVGGSNILSSGGALSNSRFVNLDLDSPSTASGHTIDIFGAGNNQIIRTYVHNVPDNLTAFRLRGVNWLLDSVIAQDTGSTGTGWGIIGEDIANDGQSTPTFLDCRGCTITLWSGADAVDFRANSYGSFRYSTINTASSGLNKRAFRFRGITSGQTGIFDAESKIVLNGTATWANSLPVHSVEPPFVEVGAEEIGSYYDTALTTSIAMAGVREVRVDSSRAGVSIKNIATGTSAGTGFISHLRFAADNTYDIGTSSSGQRPANMYAASEIWAGNAFRAGAPAGSTGEIRMQNSSNSNTLRLSSGVITPSDYTWTFPAAVPSAGTEFLQISNTGAVTSTPTPWINKGVVSSTQTTVANTVTETDIMGTVDAGSKTISANTAKQFQIYSLKLRGTMNDTGTPTIRFQLKLGSTVIADTTAINLVTITGGGCTWEIDAYFSVLSLGASGSVRVHQFGFMYDQTNAGVRYHVAPAPATTTIDTTASQQIVVTVTWGTANASNTITRELTLVDQTR